MYNDNTFLLSLLFRGDGMTYVYCDARDGETSLLFRGDGMTYVYCDVGDEKYFLRAVGHAEGSPEVCAAVSSIVYALAGYLENAKALNTAEVYDQKLESGDVEIYFGGDDTARAVFEMAVIGIMQIAKAHPELVQVDLKN